MKVMRFLVFILTVTCASSIQVNGQTVSNEVEKLDLEAGWEAFRMAIYKKDTALLKVHSTDNIKEYTAILYMLSELYVLNKLGETNLEDLERVNFEGEECLKFYAEDVGIDEFGYEYATAVTLYFIESDKGLLFAHYRAAG